MMKYSDGVAAEIHFFAAPLYASENTMQRNSEHQIVISWTDAEDEKPPCYTVALYGSKDALCPIQCLYVDDNDDSATREEIAAAIEELKGVAGVEDIDVEWDI